MEFWFTYTVYNVAQLLRIGKGNCLAKNQDAVERYLHSRYGYDGWNGFGFKWHFSEAAALKAEDAQLIDYAARYGELPVWNRAFGGGGRQIYQKCKAVKINDQPCRNDAHAGNYGFCRVHRR